MTCTVTHQLPIHVHVLGRADEDSFLHETDETPVRVRLVLNFSQHWRAQVRHALGVAVIRVSNCVVQ